MNNILWCTISGICIFSNLICRKPGLKHEIKSKILAEAEMNIGCAMTYTLIEWVKEHIEELFANYSEKTESSLELMDSLSIIEKVFQLTIFVHPHVCILFLFSYFNKLQPGVKESKETKETKETRVQPVLDTRSPLQPPASLLELDQRLSRSLVELVLM